MSAGNTPKDDYHNELRRSIYRLSQNKTQQSHVSVATTKYEQDGGGNESIHWKTGFLARFPWIGVAALSTVLTCIAIEVVILKTSHGRTQEKWPAYQQYTWITDSWKAKAQLTPSVALAVTNTVSNLALAIAIGQGVTIAWWRNVLKGSTVAELHKSWSFSTSVFDLLMAGKHFNIVALAALMGKVALIDNLLLQRAAGNIPAGEFRDSVTIRLPLLQTLPNDYGGVFSPDGLVGHLGSSFTQDIISQTGGPFVAFESGGLEEAGNTPFDTRCKGICYGYVPAFGFNITCGERTHSHEYAVTPETAMNNTNAFRNKETLDPDETLTSLVSFNAHPETTAQIVGTNSTIPRPKVSSITLNSQWAEIVPATGPANGTNSETCKGRLVSRTCTLLPAIVKYFVQVQQGDVAIVKATGSTLNSGFQPLIDETDTTIMEYNTGDIADVNNGQVQGYKIVKMLPYDSGFDANIQAIAFWIQSSFGGQIPLMYLNGTGFVSTGIASGNSPLVSWWADLSSLQAGRQNLESCAMNITDPTAWIMTQINSLILHTSFSQAAGLYTNLSATDRTAVNQTKESTQPFIVDFQSQQQFDTIMYQTDMPFMIVAVATMLFCVICVLPSYWGFWELGRKVTLGPMEIASAFQAPVLENHAVGTGGEVDILLKEMGQTKLRYGLVEGSGRLGVAHPEEVNKLKR